MKCKQCLILAIFLFSFSLASAQEIPTLQKYVNDYAHVLTLQEIERINSLASEIEKNTTVQIAVLTVDTTQPMTIEQYAVKVFEKSGIGYKDKDNGLLIVVAVQDKKWRIEVGYGLEPIINDAKAGLIGRTYFTEPFREEQYGDGIYDAVAAINKVIQNSGDTSFISEGNKNFLVVIAIVIITLAIIPVLIIALVFRDVFYRKCPRCGGRMRRYKKNGWIIYECVKCKKKYKVKKRWSHWFFIGGLGGGWTSGGGGGGGGGFGGGGSGGGGASGGW